MKTRHLRKKTKNSGPNWWDPEPQIYRYGTAGSALLFSLSLSQRDNRGAFSLPQRIRVKQSLSLRVGAFWAQSRPQFSIISSHITSLIYLPSSSHHRLHQHLLLSKVLFLSFLFFLFSHIFSATKHCCCWFSFGLYASDLISSCAVKKKKKN